MRCAEEALLAVPGSPQLPFDNEPPSSASFPSYYAASSHPVSLPPLIIDQVSAHPSPQALFAACPGARTGVGDACQDSAASNDSLAMTAPLEWPTVPVGPTAAILGAEQPPTSLQPQPSLPPPLSPPVVADTNTTLPCPLPARPPEGCDAVPTEDNRTAGTGEGNGSGQQTVVAGRNEAVTPIGRSGRNNGPPATNSSHSAGSAFVVRSPSTLGLSRVVPLTEPLLVAAAGSSTGSSAGGGAGAGVGGSTGSESTGASNGGAGTGAERKSAVVVLPADPNLPPTPAPSTAIPSSAAPAPASEPPRPAQLQVLDTVARRSAHASSPADTAAPCVAEARVQTSDSVIPSPPLPPPPTVGPQPLASVPQPAVQLPPMTEETPPSATAGPSPVQYGEAPLQNTLAAEAISSPPAVPAPASLPAGEAASAVAIPPAPSPPHILAAATSLAPPILPHQPAVNNVTPANPAASSAPPTHARFPWLPPGLTAFLPISEPPTHTLGPAPTVSLPAAVNPPSTSPRASPPTLLAPTSPLARSASAPRHPLPADAVVTTLGPIAEPPRPLERDPAQQKQRQQQKPPPPPPPTALRSPPFASASAGAHARVVSPAGRDSWPPADRGEGGGGGYDARLVAPPPADGLAATFAFFSSASVRAPAAAASPRQLPATPRPAVSMTAHGAPEASSTISGWASAMSISPRGTLARSSVSVSGLSATLPYCPPVGGGGGSSGRLATPHRSLPTVPPLPPLSCSPVRSPTRDDGPWTPLLPPGARSAVNGYLSAGSMDSAGAPKSLTSSSSSSSPGPLLPGRRSTHSRASCGGRSPPGESAGPPADGAAFAPPSPPSEASRDGGRVDDSSNTAASASPPQSLSPRRRHSPSVSPPGRRSLSPGSVAGSASRGGTTSSLAASTAQLGCRSPGHGGAPAPIEALLGRPTSRERGTFFPTSRAEAAATIAVRSPSVIAEAPFEEAHRVRPLRNSHWHLFPMPFRLLILDFPSPYHCRDGN